MAATQQEVSRSTKTLKQAITDGEVPKPPLCAWNGWQNWRKELGERPTIAKDGFNPQPGQESKLWKDTMKDLYGPEWSEKLAEGDTGEGSGASGSVPSVAPVAPRLDPQVEPTGTPVAAGVPVPDTEPVTPRRIVDPLNPGSGDSKDIASPGSGTSGSWNSREPGSAEGLRDRLLREYKPGVDNLEAFLNKVRRQAVVLAQMNMPLGEGALEIVIEKAVILQKT